jgi:hypothetical protein
MNVNKVTATVRYTQDTGKGAWKSLELGCEASIDERENWRAAQAQLYAELASQFKTLWSQNGYAHGQTHQEGPRIDAQPAFEENHVRCVVVVTPERVRGRLCKWRYRDP